MRRETSCAVANPQVEVMETTHPRKGVQRWQPTYLREELTEWADEDDSGWSYTVKVTGKLLRKDGTIGLNPTAITYVSPPGRWTGGVGIEHLPADIAALLVGIEGLRDWKRLEATS